MNPDEFIVLAIVAFTALTVAWLLLDRERNVPHG